MKTIKNINAWRAEKLGYVLFSRLANLIIDEATTPNHSFDLLIDIGEKNKRTLRLFGVEIKSAPYMANKTDLEKYKNIYFPAVIAIFDNRTDSGSYLWIKKPGKNGDLLFNQSDLNPKPLDTQSLIQIVSEIEEWYAKKSVAITAA